MLEDIVAHTIISALIHSGSLVFRRQTHAAWTVEANLVRPQIAFDAEMLLAHLAPISMTLAPSTDSTSSILSLSPSTSIQCIP